MPDRKSEKYSMFIKVLAVFSFLLFGAGFASAEVLIWGQNNYGQLGDGTITDRTRPLQVNGLGDVAAIAGGEYHTIALKSDGTVWVWGHNGSGKSEDFAATDAATAESLKPSQVSGLADVTAIAGGGSHTIALKSDGTVWAWGRNGNGELGSGTATGSLSPLQVDGLADVTAIAGGGSHTIALKSDGTVWVWGYNGFGQLGNGATTDSPTPVQVKGLRDVAAIAGGADHTIALKSDGTVWAWGYNGFGQLGNGTTTDSPMPLQVSGLGDVEAIAGGRYNTLALKSDGTVWVWGNNVNGELGDGTTTDRLTPVQVQGLRDVAAIAGGGYHTLALRSDGTVWAWGFNGNGGLGDGTTTDSPAPVHVQGLRDVAAIAGGGLHALVLTESLLPDLVVSSLAAPSFAGPGVKVVITDITQNRVSVGDAPASKTNFYLSTSSYLNGSEILLGSRTVPSLATGASSMDTMSLTIPSGTATGAYYIIAKADGPDLVVETSEINNTRAASIKIGPDLQVSTLTAPSAAKAGGKINVTDITQNSTNGGNAPASTTSFYLSVNSILDGSDILLGSRAVPALAVGSSNLATTSLTIPSGTASGPYFIIAKADGPDLLTETNEANNIRLVSIGIGPDLLVASLTAPSFAGPGVAVVITDITQNSASGGDAPASKTNFYLSASSVLAGSDILLGSRSVPALAAGTSSMGTTSLTIPSGTATGAYYIIAKADGPGLVVETSEINNTKPASIRIGPDLAVLSLTVSSSAKAGGKISVTDITQNSTPGGNAPASTTNFYLSTKSVLAEGDILLGNRSVPALTVGSSSMATTSLTIPPGTETGIYYVIAKADGPDLVSETSEANNTKTASVKIGPDLVISSFTVPSVAKAGGRINVQDTTRNAGGDAPASKISFYLSTGSVLDEDCILLGDRSVPALTEGTSSMGTTSLTIPSGTATGAYYIIAKADGPDLVSETSESNNTRIASIRLGPDLVVSSFTVPSVAKAGGKISITDVTQDIGGGNAHSSTTRFYLSRDSVIDGGDITLGSRSVPWLAAGTNSTETTSLTIPSGTTTGTYYIIAKADDPGLISETNEANNTRSVAFTIGPDLSVMSLTTPSGAGAGAAINIADTTMNIGGGDAVSSTTNLYLSLDNSLDGSDVLLGGRTVPAMTAAGSSTGTTSVTIPSGTVPGVYHIIAKADGPGLIGETSESNNTRSAAINIGPDLTVSSLTVPSSAGVGAPVNVTDTTMNSGDGDTVSSTTSLYLSPDNSLDGSDVLLGSRTVPAMTAAGSSTGTTSVTIPSGTVPGAYYIIAKADGPGLIGETSESNNTRSAAINIGPDFTVSSLTVPSGTNAGNKINVMDTTRNRGGGDAPASTTSFYLSTDEVLDGGDIMLGNRAVPALAAAANSTVKTSLTTPAGTAPGAYYIIAKADGPDLVSEADKTNNTRSRLITIGPDLSVSSLTAVDGAGAGETIMVMDTTINTGGGYSGASRTRFYLSEDSVLDGSDIRLGNRFVSGLAAGAGNTGTTSLTIPSEITAGSYYIIAKADVYDMVSETDEDNNTRAISIRIGPDLIVSSLTVPSSAVVGVQTNVMFVTKNRARGGDAPASTTSFYLSTDEVLSGTDILLKSKAVPGLAAGAGSTGSITMTIPSGTATGTYHLIVKADGPDLIGEADETNNTIYKVLKVQ